MLHGSSSSTRKRNGEPTPKRGEGKSRRAPVAGAARGKSGASSHGSAARHGAAPKTFATKPSRPKLASSHESAATEGGAQPQRQEQSPQEKAAPSPFKQSLEKVRAVIEPVILGRRVELVELSWVTERTGRTLRITIERSGVGPTLADQLLVGFGVSLEDCAEVSRDVSAALDLADIIPHAYCLEVSSPGLDRPLRHVADFVRFVGQTAKVKLREPASDGQRVLRGRLRQVAGYDSSATADSARISIEVDGKVIEVPYGSVESANLVYELPTQPKSNARVGTSQEREKSTYRERSPAKEAARAVSPQVPSQRGRSQPRSQEGRSQQGPSSKGGSKPSRHASQRSTSSKRG